MLNLLKVDFKRVLKDKLFMIVCFIGLGFALFTPLLYKSLFSSLGVEEAIDILFSAKGILFNCFSLTNNFGLILPIFISIILLKDFSNGTIRNKIINGHKRSNIFLSTFIVCSTVFCGLILAYGLTSFFFALILGFNYSDNISFGNDLGYFFLSLLFICLIYIFISAYISWLTVSTKSVGLTIVLYFVTIIVMTILLTILQLFGSLDLVSKSSTKVIKFVLDTNPFHLVANVIGKKTSYTLPQALKIILPTILASCSMVLFGISAIRKKDIK